MILNTYSGDEMAVELHEEFQPEVVALHLEVRRTILALSLLLASSAPSWVGRAWIR